MSASFDDPTHGRLRSCTRREILKVAGAVAACSLVTVSGVATIGNRQPLRTASPSARSLILVFLHGGPSHIDLWDPKPGLPESMRSPFAAIPTRIDGVQFTELLPLLASVNDRLSLIRSLSFTPGDTFYHDSALSELHVGSSCAAANSSTVAPALRSRSSAEHGFFEQLVRADGMQRIVLRADLGCGTKSGHTRAPRFASAHYPSASSQVEAQETEHAPAALPRASQEHARVVARYGDNGFGRALLRARQLVQAGTRVVEVHWPHLPAHNQFSWDVHENLTEHMRRYSAPVLDRGLSALILDLKQRDLLDDTMVVATGEFGRSPIKGASTSGNGTSFDGRDHWPQCNTAVVAGGGARPGLVFGESDETASYPVRNALTPRDLLSVAYGRSSVVPRPLDNSDGCAALAAFLFA